MSGLVPEEGFKMWEKVSKFAAASVALASLGTFALAQGSPPTMPAITFPIDTASIVTAIATAGATLLILVFGVRVGFKFVWKLMRRTQSSV